MDGVSRSRSTSSSSRSHDDDDNKPITSRGKPDRKKIELDDGDGIFVENGDVLVDAHRLATSRSDADSRRLAADPSVGANGDNTGTSGARHREMDEGLADIQKIREWLASDTSTSTPEAMAVKQRLLDALEEHANLIKEARQSNHDCFPREFLSNVLSGANAFLMCFGTGTLTASALGIPAAGWAISTVLWALMERIPPMIRNATWSNPHAEKTYPLIGNLIQRAARDKVRESLGMQARHPGSDRRDASDNSEDVQLSDIAVKDFLQAWLGKMVTEDLPYYFYTLFYGVRYSIIGGLSWSATSFYSLSTLLIAGTLAGASTAVTTHGLRRLLYKPAGNEDPFKGQTLTKTMDMWEKELQILQLWKQLIALGQHTSVGEKQEEAGAIGMQEVELLDAAIQKAEQKSRFSSSLWFEIKALFQLRRGVADQRGEVAGKLSEFLAGFAAKGTVLSLSTIWNYGFTTPMLEATASAGGKIGIMWGQYFVLILAFNSRKEFELAYRGVLGLGLGLYDVISERCGCIPASGTTNADAEGKRSFATLPSFGSTAELGKEYRAKHPKAKPQNRNHMDGGDDDVNDNSGNRNTGADDIDD